MATTVKDGVAWRGWCYRDQRISFKGLLGGVNQEASLRQHFLSWTVEWVAVPATETDVTGRSPCVLGKENPRADYELRFRFVDARRYLPCSKENFRWVIGRWVENSE